MMVGGKNMVWGVKMTFLGLFRVKGLGKRGEKGGKEGWGLKMMDG